MAGDGVLYLAQGSDRLRFGAFSHHGPTCFGHKVASQLPSNISNNDNRCKGLKLSSILNYSTQLTTHPGHPGLKIKSINSDEHTHYLEPYDVKSWIRERNHDLHLEEDPIQRNVPRCHCQRVPELSPTVIQSVSVTPSCASRMPEKTRKTPGCAKGARRSGARHSCPSPTGSHQPTLPLFGQQRYLQPARAELRDTRQGSEMRLLLLFFSFPVPFAVQIKVCNFILLG